MKKQQTIEHWEEAERMKQRKAQQTMNAFDSSSGREYPKTEIENAQTLIGNAIIALERAEQQLTGSRAQDYVKEVTGWLSQSYSELVLAKRLAKLT